MLCIFQGLGDNLEWNLSSILPGKEIPNGFEKANMRDGSVLASLSFHILDYSVNIQLPRSGFDELRAILLCIVFVPCEHFNPYNNLIEIKSIKVDGIWYQLGVSIGRAESGLCPTQTRPELFRWRKI